MNQTDLERYRRALQELRDRSRDEINRMIEVVLEDGQAAGEHDHKVSEWVGKELALEHSEESIRTAVLDALRLIDEGRYGQCQQCGAPISKERLDAMPFALYCLGCERQREEQAVASA